MYKSRLHSWGLDKKKKEHEMLDLVRQGLMQKGDDREKVFIVRGRQVTLADALHYFNRKGIKDPSTLLEPNALVDSSNDASSPEDYDVRTPLSSRGDFLETGHNIDSDSDLTHASHNAVPPSIPAVLSDPKTNNYVERHLLFLQHELHIPHWESLQSFPKKLTDGGNVSRPGTQLELRYLDAIYVQAKTYCTQIFSANDLSVVNTSWSATSDNALADQFFYSMYQGYGFFWNDQRDQAIEYFQKAFGMIHQLLKDRHIGFLIYLFDLIIRHDRSGYDEPLLMLLRQTADTASALSGPDHPIHLIASWLRHPEGEVSRPWIAESALRKILEFFQDSIGYFHPMTIALLQTFANGLMNAKQYRESAVRFRQLVEAFETTQSMHSYEVCYALRTMSEAYFHAEMYQEALQALKLALDWSVGLPHLEEREIHARCLRGIAEIYSRLGKRDEAVNIMQYVVDCCIETFGPDHPFVSRAKAHQKSVREGSEMQETAIPPVVYRLGRGGAAAKFIWTTRSSPVRLQA